MCVLPSAFTGLGRSPCTRTVGCIRVPGLAAGLGLGLVVRLLLLYLFLSKNRMDNLHFFCYAHRVELFFLDNRLWVYVLCPQLIFCCHLYHRWSFHFAPPSAYLPSAFTGLGRSPCECTDGCIRVPGLAAGLGFELVVRWNPILQRNCGFFLEPVHVTGSVLIDNLQVVQVVFL